MIHFVTWLWGDKYGVADVNKLCNGIRRNVRHRTFSITLVTSWRGSIMHDVDCSVVPILGGDLPLLQLPGCFARLRIFDPVWQEMMGMRPLDRIVQIDLDAVITARIDPIFDNRDEHYVILGGANAANPCPFNGSLQMLRAGCHPEVWHEFSLAKAQAVPFYQFPDDQGWIWHKLPKAATWQAGGEWGVYAFKKPGWPPGDNLPFGARMVVFPGARQPSQFAYLPWVKEHWR